MRGLAGDSEFHRRGHREPRRVEMAQGRRNVNRWPTGGIVVRRTLRRSGETRLRCFAPAPRACGSKEGACGAISSFPGLNAGAFSVVVLRTTWVRLLRSRLRLFPWSEGRGFLRCRAPHDLRDCWDRARRAVRRPGEERPRILRPLERAQDDIFQEKFESVVEKQVPRSAYPIRTCGTDGAPQRSARDDNFKSEEKPRVPSASLRPGSSPVYVDPG